MFETAAGAVAAALDIQKELKSAKVVHLGYVIEKADATVYGDRVNIAARLQGVAEPGGVSISDVVYGAARDRLPGVLEARANTT